MSPLSRLDPQPAGFGFCPSCAYRETGTPLICYTCVTQKVELIDPDGCKVCGLQLNSDGSCRNYLCSWPTRFFERNYAVAMRTGAIQQAINRYKYENATGWATIFGRVLAGYINEHAPELEEYDLILPSPTYVAESGDVRQWDHIKLILERSRHDSDNAWPFAFAANPVIIKTTATTPMVGKKWKERRVIAETELHCALRVPDPSQSVGKNILVFDDVFTDGFTLREIARCLIQQGNANMVSGITLVRQPWHNTTAS